MKLDGKIGVSFHLSLDANLVNTGAYMQFTLNDETSEKILAKDVETTTIGGNIYYIFPYEVAAKEMSDSITANFYDNSYTVEVSPMYYIRTMLKKADTTDELTNLLCALYSYYEQAEIYWSESTENQ